VAPTVNREIRRAIARVKAKDGEVKVFVKSLRKRGFIASGALAVQLVAGILFCSVALSQPGAAQASNAEPAALTGLVPHHVTISVEDLDRVSQWYVRVLGFKITQRFDTNPDFLLRQLSIPGYRIDMVKYKGSARPAPVNPRYLQQGWIHVAFSVPDLPAAYKELQALNTDVTADKDAKGVPTRVILHDPEGNEIEFFKPL
jgi:catechol 2,3-dioxygenase-like lactoylglutathione lyase family enzyme